MPDQAGDIKIEVQSLVKGLENFNDRKPSTVENIIEQMPDAVPPQEEEDKKCCDMNAENIAQVLPAFVVGMAVGGALIWLISKDIKE